MLTGSLMVWAKSAEPCSMSTGEVAVLSEPTSMHEYFSSRWPPGDCLFWP